MQNYAHLTTYSLTIILTQPTRPNPSLKTTRISTKWGNLINTLVDIGQHTNRAKGCVSGRRTLWKNWYTNIPPDLCATHLISIPCGRVYFRSDAAKAAYRSPCLCLRSDQSPQLVGFWVNAFEKADAKRRASGHNCHSCHSCHSTATNDPTSLITRGWHVARFV